MTVLWSVAMTGAVHAALADHLLRADGQEDVCLATYRPSTGVHRRSGVLGRVVTPEDGDRFVHGNASFTSQYLLRAAALASADSRGVVALHSHPGARGWQDMSPADRQTEAGYANLVREVTGLPLIGMTLASDQTWSARFWDEGVGREVQPRECESVRVLGHDALRVSWNDALRPPPPPSPSQLRTVSCWGDALQADLARLRVLVVGAGSVGLLVAVALAATGIEQVGTMDFDTVEQVNLDRLLGATRLDARLGRSKAALARRLVADASTARRVDHRHWEDSVCEPEGFRRALDFDVVFSCVDRPWPRHALNTIAYSDLIP